MANWKDLVPTDVRVFSFKNFKLLHGLSLESLQGFWTVGRCQNGW